MAAELHTEKNSKGMEARREDKSSGQNSIYSASCVSFHDAISILDHNFSLATFL